MLLMVYALVTCRFPNSAYDAFDTLHLQCLQFRDEIDDAGEKVLLEDACDHRGTVGQGLAGGGGGGRAGNDTLLV